MDSNHYEELRKLTEELRNSKQRVEDLRGSKEGVINFAPDDVVLKYRRKGDSNCHEYINSMSKPILILALEQDMEREENNQTMYANKIESEIKRLTIKRKHYEN